MATVKPLKLISKRLSPPTRLGGFQTRPVKGRRPVNKHWLWPTTDVDGQIKPQYRTTVVALAGLYGCTEQLQSLRRVLRKNQLEAAESLWLETLARGAEAQTQVDSWKELSLLSPSGTYGPPVFKNVLEAITDLHASNPRSVLRLIRPINPSTDAYVLPAIVGSLGSKNPDLGISILAQQKWGHAARLLGLNALLYAANMDPRVVIETIRNVPLPPDFQLQPDLERRLLEHTSDIACIEVIQALSDANADLSSPVMDKILRRVFSYSDRGADAVLKNVTSATYPLTLYPFVVRQLCKRVAAGSTPARTVLDDMFDKVIPRLAESEPSLVLHLLVMRVIATDGVHATAPVLDRWVASDPNGVSEPTWLLIFQAFRRIGRPDKCVEVLVRALESTPRLSMPFVGEYLAYVAQFYNLHVYLASLRKVLPGIAPVLVMLGIRTYEKQLPSTNKAYLEPMRIKLGPKNRAFKANSIHESWLTLTYQAVLATVDDHEQALRLYKNYMRYTIYSKTPTSLRVVDQFVKLLASKNVGLDAAEWVYRDALRRLHIKRPTDGSNNAAALEELCYRFVRTHQFERAAKLLNDALAHDRVVVRGSVLRHVVEAAPPQLQDRLAEWAHGLGALLPQARNPAQ